MATGHTRTGRRCTRGSGWTTECTVLAVSPLRRVRFTKATLSVISFRGRARTRGPMGRGTRGSGGRTRCTGRARTVIATASHGVGSSSMASTTTVKCSCLFGNRPRQNGHEYSYSCWGRADMPASTVRTIGEGCVCTVLVSDSCCLFRT